MKKVLLIPILLAMGLPLFAQSISPHVIASTGGQFSQTTAQLEFTVGEVAIATYNIGSNLLSQGFHQPIIVVDAIDDALIGFSMNVYPNPTTQSLLLESDAPLPSNLHFLLVDAKGSTILTGDWQKNETQKALDLSQLAEGTYFLQLIHTQSTATRTFKVQKLSR
ncbi:MAG: T9SS type A sorting domain-containing protein [Bacteroidia bacterium]